MSPTRGRQGKRRAKASRAKRAPAKRAASRGKSAAKRKAAPKRKPVARKTAPKRKPVARKTATQRAVAKRSGGPALQLVKRPAPKRARPARAPKPFEGAIATASAKDLALFDLVRARVAVQAAIQGVPAGWAETPIAEGKWTPRQILLHLHFWDREMLPWIEKTHRLGQRPPHTLDDIHRMNDAYQEEAIRHSWDDARRLMQQSREALLEALQSLSEEPAEMWSGEHALGWLIRILAHHDRHHAARLKDARGGPTPPGSLKGTA